MTIMPVVVLTILYGKSLQRKTCVTKDERSTQWTLKNELD
jgi:hypothetical protein